LHVPGAPLKRNQAQPGALTSCQPSEKENERETERDVEKNRKKMKEI
jgi:hypothetical protein